MKEAKVDDNSRYYIYLVLSVTEEEGKPTDVCQNRGRFLHKYAEPRLKEVAQARFLDRYSVAGSRLIPNALGPLPQTHEIDHLVSERDAIEIKWHYATIDGDHTTKEQTRMQNAITVIYNAIRVIFYLPNPI